MGRSPCSRIYGSNLDGGNMKEIILQLVMAFVGSLGFSMLFHLRKSLWITASLGGLFCWGCYLLGMYFTERIFAAGFLAAAFAAIYSEILAFRKKAPTTLFVIPAVVPLIPGSTLYYTMSAVVSGKTADISHYGNITVQYALSIAAGISVVWTVWSIFRKIQIFNNK